MILLTNFNIDTSQDPWAYPNFKYRVPITISNPNNYDLTDFQVLIKVDTASLISAGKMRGDCGDIRFADSNGNKLSYWIEEELTNPLCNRVDTPIWVRVPHIPSSGSTTIYMYYGNPNAASESNGDATFYFFDDFNRGRLDESKWIPYSNNYTVSGGYIRINEGGIEKACAFPFGLQDGYIVETRFQYSGTGSGTTYGGVIPQLSSSSYLLPYNDYADANVRMSRGSGTTSLYYWIANGSSPGYYLSYRPLNVSADTSRWYIGGISVVSVSGSFDNITFELVSVKFWLDRTMIGDVSGEYRPRFWYKPLIYIRLGSFNRYSPGTPLRYPNIQDTSYDWVLVRKYAANMPTSSIGPEESAPPIFSVELISPAECPLSYSDTIDFTFRAVGNRDSYSCELYIDGTPEGSTIASNNTPVTLTVSGIGGGVHEWYISCTADSTTVQSERRHFMIPITITTITTTETTTTTTTETLTVTRIRTGTTTTTETQTETVTQSILITLPVTVTETLKQTVTVAKVIEKRPSRIFLNVTPVSEVGREVTVRGSLDPPISGALIKLRYRIGGTESPADVITGLGGNFSHSFVPQMGGYWKIDASWAGDTTHYGSEASAYFFVKKRRSEMYLEATPVVKKNGTVEIKGWVVPSNALVTLSASKDGREWKVAELSGNFSYKYDVSGLEAGTYLLKASWGGDEGYEGTEAIVPFAIGESMEVVSAFPDILCYIPMVSSSTELAVSFNAKQGYLSVTTGRAGETGGSLFLLVPDCCLERYEVDISDVIFLLDESEAEKNLTKTPFGYLTEVKFGPGPHTISVYYLTYDLTLKVLDFQGDPAPLARVELVGPVKKRAFTNESGIVELTLPPGKYRVVADTTQLDIELNESKSLEIRTERGRIAVEYEEAKREIVSLQTTVIALIILLAAVTLSSYIFYTMRRRTWIERALEQYFRDMGEEVDRKRIEEIYKSLRKRSK